VGSGAGSSPPATPVEDENARSAGSVRLPRVDALDSLEPGEPQPGVPVSPEQKAPADRVLAEILQDLGENTALGDYRRVYATLGVEWPGEQRIRELYPVAG
jgi:hypothetical protein